MCVVLHCISILPKIDIDDFAPAIERERVLLGAWPQVAETGARADGRESEGGLRRARVVVALRRIPPQL